MSEDQTQLHLHDNTNLRDHRPQLSATNGYHTQLTLTYYCDEQKGKPSE